MARRNDIASYYATLQVSQSATIDEVKSSYKRLALKYHPDKNGSPDATARFQEIGIAYRAIIDHIEQPTLGPNWSQSTSSFYPFDPYRDREEDFFMDFEFFLFMFAFGYGRRDCPPPFNLHRHRPQKPDWGGETDAERVARGAREREEQKKPDWGGETDAERAARGAREREEQKQARRTAAARERAEKAKEEYRAKDEARRAERGEASKVAHQKKRSAIFIAARSGRWEQVKKGIWEEDIDADGGEVLIGLEEIVPKPKEPQETLLHLAAKAGVMDVFKWLVDHGAEPEARDSFARTPFHLALQYGHLPLVHHILTSFPPGSPDSHPVLSRPPKASLLRLAIESSNVDIVKIVMSLFKVSESDVTQEWKRLKDPAFANGFPISRSYGGGRGGAELRNPTGWKEILQLLQENLPPDVIPSDFPHHQAPPSEADQHPRYGQDAKYPFSFSSRIPGDLNDEPTSKPNGSNTRPKRDKARRKRGTGNKHK